ncbi:hypothetical protein [Ancylobacter pratisalsi]|uniref:Uncharacterized protein n=1 Tax=Ancylobacter pratisalsi TaxID=1745854 RepID=A0A6P1YNC7_9HYPH|nr:hypothetical protein [Ancylobacter pratisalsi]QIB34562.1 hypothetical protein G3A50_13195 [Ancylobacter pratisalsi]
MCSDCFGDEDLLVGAAGATFPPEQLAAAARRIETDMCGELVPSQAWRIYFGAASGAVGWREMERMARCVEAARVLLSLEGHTSQ